jgi:hypothetical protein
MVVVEKTVLVIFLFDIFYDLDVLLPNSVPLNTAGVPKLFQVAARKKPEFQPPNCAADLTGQNCYCKSF